MAINYLAAGEFAPVYEGFPIFKNRVRESLGFGSIANYQVQTTLNSSGWPMGPFQCNLYVGSAQSWNTGVFQCGYTTNGSGPTQFSGNEVIAHVNGGTVTVQSYNSTTGAVLFTLDTTSSGNGNFGFQVTGQSNSVTLSNIFAYLPEYNSNTAIDNPTTASAYTTEAINFYKQFAYVRWMWWSNALYNTSQTTSANRNTASTSQTVTTVSSQGTNFTLANTLAINATTVNLSAAWTRPNGNYAFQCTFSSGTGCILAAVTTSGGTTTLTFPALTAAVTSTAVYVDGEGPPFEWIVAFANACGNGLWFNTPIYEDATVTGSGSLNVGGMPGSYSTALLQYLGSNYTGPGPVIFEFGNENIWNQYPCTYVINAIVSASTGLTQGFNSTLDYFAVRCHTFANLARTYLPSGWWNSKVFQVCGIQTATGNGPFYAQGVLASLVVVIRRLRTISQRWRWHPMSHRP